MANLTSTIIYGDLTVTNKAKVNSDLTLGGNILDINDTTVLAVTGVTSAVNYLEITNSITGTDVNITTAGTDTNIDLLITTKGTGALILDSGTGIGQIDLKAGTGNVRIWDDNSTHYYKFVTGDRTANYNINLPAGDVTIPAGTLAVNNQTMYIGTTAVAINRVSAILALTGITSIDGSAATLTLPRNFTIGATTRAFNGSAAVSWTLGEIGATTVGSNLFTLTNPTAITFIRINADNTISTLDAATFRTAIGAGTSSTIGTVTSVSMTVPTGLSISGSPITTSGTLALTLTAGYSIPSTSSQTNWDTAYTDRNKWDGGSTGLTASTGRASLGSTTVGSNLFTLTNPTAITFIRINADNSVSTLDAVTFRTAIGAGTSSTVGTVTSVSLSLPSILTVSGSPITTSGTLTATLASQTANYFFAAPNGSAGSPVFRVIVAADIPTLNQNTTGNATTATTATNIAAGANGSIPYNTTSGTTTFLAIGTVGKIIRSNGTIPTWSTATYPDTTTANRLLYSSATNTISELTTTSNTVLTANSSGVPTWTTLDLSIHLPDSSFKKAVRVATNGDLGASTFSANVLTGYSNTLNLNVSTTLNSTTATTTSTAGIKVGAVISGNANIPAATTVVSITNATTFVLSVNATATASSIATTFTQTIAALVVDGVTLVLNDRVLVKDQSTSGGLLNSTGAKYNGIYYVTATGSTTVPWALTRTTDADSATDIDAAIVNVSVGTANYGKTYKTRFNGTNTLNTTEMYWNRLIDVNAGYLTALPTTAIGIDITTDTESVLIKTGNVTDLTFNSFGIKTVLSVAASTYTRASTIYIAGAPVASTNATITNTYSLYIAGGNSYLGAAVTATSFNSITALANTNPLMNGTVSIGTSTLVARQDHAHPVDTSRAAIAQTMYIGTTAVAINRTSATLTLAGVSLSTLTIGTGLSGTSYNGSAGITIAIDSTVTTLTGNQILTNKTFSDSTTYFSDDVTPSKTMQFQLSSITTATNRTLTIPDADGTIALLSLVQTFSAAQTFSSTLSGSSTVSLTGSTSSATSLGTSATTGTLTLGGTAQTGNIILGRSTAAHTFSIDSGATISGATKTINIGTAGVTGSTTAINIGSSTSTTTITFNGISNLAGFDTLIHVGDRVVNNSDDAMILISRNVTGTSGNGHAFSDSSNISRTGGIGYNSFDCRVEFTGATANFNHYAGFQFAPTMNFTGTMDNNYGLFTSATITSGTISNNYGIYIANPTGAGTITNNYGIYIADQTKGSTVDYAIFSAGSASSSFAGNILIGFNQAAATSKFSVTNSTASGAAGFEMIGDSGGGYIAYYGSTNASTHLQDKVVLGANANALKLTFLSTNGFEFKTTNDVSNTVSLTSTALNLTANYQKNGFFVTKNIATNFNVTTTSTVQVNTNVSDYAFTQSAAVTGTYNFDDTTFEHRTITMITITGGTAINFTKTAAGATIYGDWTGYDGTKQNVITILTIGSGTTGIKLMVELKKY